MSRRSLARYIRGDLDGYPLSSGSEESPSNDAGKDIGKAVQVMVLIVRRQYNHS